VQDIPSVSEAQPPAPASDDPAPAGQDVPSPEDVQDIPIAEADDATPASEGHVPSVPSDSEAQSHAPASDNAIVAVPSGDDLPGDSEVNADSPLTPPDATPAPRKPGTRLADTTPKPKGKPGPNKQRNAKPKPKPTPGTDDLPKREPRPKMTQAERLAALSTPNIRDERITPGCHKYKPPVRGLAYRGSVEGTTYKHRDAKLAAKSTDGKAVTVKDKSLGPDAKEMGAAGGSSNCAVGGGKVAFGKCQNQKGAAPTPGAGPSKSNRKVASGGSAPGA